MPLGINLHMGKTFGRDESHCTSRGTRKEAGPTVPLGKNLCLREELGHEWVTLCHQGQICM